MTAEENTAENDTETDEELVARYARTGAERAFATLVQRHSGGVYGTALRMVRSPQLAEEIAQTVFIELARRAGHLRGDLILVSWLHRITRSRSVDVIRGEVRRRRREQVASRPEDRAMSAVPSEMEAMLDDAIASLGEKDRAAVLLRFFEGRSHAEIGTVLGVSADAAQKRVERSVVHLRHFYSKRGHTVGAAGVSAALAAASATATTPRLCRSVRMAVDAAVSFPAGAGFSSSIVMALGFKILVPILAAAAVAGFLFHQDHGTVRPDDAGPRPLPDSRAPALVARHPQSPADRTSSKAFVRPRLNEAGKRDLARDPAAVLTGHDAEGKWTTADEDLLVAWAARDPEAAMAWVGAGEHHVVQARLLGAVAAGILLREGPEAARRFLAQHHDDEQLRPKDQDDLESYLFRHLGREDTFDLALTLLASGHDQALAGDLVAGVEGSRNQVAAIDYLEAKGQAVSLDYWTFQSEFDREPEFWSDWALQRNSELIVDIVQSWARQQPDIARAWMDHNLPAGDPRRTEIEARMEIPAPPADPR